MRENYIFLYQKMRKTCSNCKTEKWIERFPKKGNQCKAGQCFNDCWALCNLRPLSAKKNLMDGVTRARHNLDGK